ncbi:MAG TPA: ATP-binding protein [Burkholderiales bacterium]|nr:ATP-binding protein [Burkholderiales bacterium]
MASEELDRLIANLRRLKLAHAANNLQEHLRQADELKLGRLAFFSKVIEAEVIARNETGTKRRLEEARFPEILRIDDYDFKFQVCLDRQQLLDVAELGFVDRCQAVLFIGPSGVGKSHLAIGLGVRACAAGYHVCFARANDLLKRLWAAIADNTLDEVLDEYSRPHLLILDELTQGARKPEHDYAAVFYELVYRRYRRGAMILTTNLGLEQWPTALGTPSLVTPAVDRLLDASHLFVFPPDAPSFRAQRREAPGPLPRSRRTRRRGRAKAKATH